MDGRELWKQLEMRCLRMNTMGMASLRDIMSNIELNVLTSTPHMLDLPKDNIVAVEAWFWLKAELVHHNMETRSGMVGRKILQNLMTKVRKDTGMEEGFKWQEK